jgi:hypothetical protein
MNTSVWRAITVRPGREFAVARKLEFAWPHGAGPAPEVYVPTYAVQSGRRLPLLAGYVLASYGDDQRHWIVGDGRVRHRDVTGVLAGLVSAGELAAVRMAEAAGAIPAQSPIRPGDAVQAQAAHVVIEGRFQRAEHGRAWILTELLGRLVSVPVALESVRKIA